jgi:hypothetical protein
MNVLIYCKINRRPHWLRLSALVAGAALAPVAAAQSDTDATAEQLLQCDAITQPAEKLECVNAVIESVKSSRAAGQRPETAAGDATPTDSSSPGETLPAAARDGRAPATPATAPAPQRATSDRAQQGNDVLETIAVPSVVHQAATDRAESARENRPASIPFEATIVSVKTYSDGRFLVRLDNGERWRETQGTKVRTPKAGRTVEVYEGSLGGLRMKIEGVPQTAWVRRLD